MPSNIPFTVHNNINIRPRANRILYTIISSSPVFFNDPNFNINNIMQNSFDEQDELVRQENIQLNISRSEIKVDNISDYANQSCTICCSEYNVGDEVSKLHCDHIFHYNCIKQWGYYNQSCPLCKTSIPYEST
jgi:hypothetical protein